MKLPMRGIQVNRWEVIATPASHILVMASQHRQGTQRGAKGGNFFFSPGMRGAPSSAAELAGAVHHQTMSQGNGATGFPAQIIPVREYSVPWQQITRPG